MGKHNHHLTPAERWVLNKLSRRIERDKCRRQREKIEQRKQEAKLNQDDPLFFRYRRLLDSDHPVSFSIDEYRQLVISEICHYCDGPLFVGKVGYGLDRKDSSQGYILENVIPCCGICNLIKGQWVTYNQMLVLAVAVKKLREEGDPIVWGRRD